METAAASAEIGPGSAGVIASRGRGGNTGAPIRGSYERGRGRGISRGHYQNSMNSMGYMGRGGFNSRGGIAGSAPGHQSRGGFAPRGMPMRGGTGLSVSVNFQSRGGFIPRGSAGIRGTGRMPMYTQTAKQHSGVDNNKTVSPMPNATATTNVTSADGTIPETGESSVNAEANANISVGPVIPSNANNTSTGTYTNFRGGRGRGGSISRGGMGRGGVHHLQHNSNLSTMHVTNTMQEHGQIRRGAPSRGRGGYMGSAPMTRPPMHQQHVANTQIASVPSLKRGAPTGPPGPKRGRYEGSPYSQRGTAPKYHQPHHHMQTMQQQATYGVSHQATTHMQSHQAYVSHDQSQAMDPYAHPYAVSNTQTSYNGYGQSAGYVSHTAPAPIPQTNNGYVSATNEYDHSQYQGYSSSYGSQQDTRYQSYGQDYTQQYGAPAVDYNTSQADYAHHTQQAYDERAYGGYDLIKHYSLN
uniref:Uncharacterized protein n=1 Tax=Glossina pallidipes TaxID=7398 RepID=A0A1B0A670_GLOPL